MLKMKPALASLLSLSLLSACVTSKTPTTEPPKIVNKCPTVILGELPPKPRAPEDTPASPQTGEWYGTVLLPWIDELERRFREGQELCKKY